MIYTVTGKEKADTVDWVAVGRPEEIIISPGHTEPILFSGIDGANKKVVIRGGSVTVPSNLSYGLKFDNCRNFRLTGTHVKGGNIGITCEKRSTDFEIDHCEVSGTGFAGIMAKDDGEKRTDPNPFVMQNVSIHHNYLHDTGGEGVYIGNSSYLKGHDLKHVHVFKNTFKNTGLESIQLGNCIEGAKIYKNTIDNYGTKNEKFQNNGVQVGEGTGGLCYRNVIRSGTGNGIIVLGIADNIIHGNVILYAGENGIYCDDRISLGTGFKFTGNIIVKPKVDCFGIQANKGLQNEITNNLFVLPGSFGVMPTRDSFLNKGTDVIVKESDNLRSMDEQLAGFLIAKYS